MRSYRRRLPHRDVPGIPVFVTWRLRNSLPPERTFRSEHLSSGRAFVTWDRLLDTARTGPCHLRRPEIAHLVNEQLRQVATNGWCTLEAYVIMPNHVHVLWTPQVPLSALLHKVKGPTALRANRLLGASGPFWQDEYFDRIIRNEQEHRRIRRYIEWNPVNAALVASPEDFLWSSAHGETGRG
jgi:REP element-mobilizing transposase RayT